MRDLIYGLLIFLCSITVHTFISSMGTVQAVQSHLSDAQNRQGSKIACDQLEDVLSQCIFYPESSTYIMESQGYWSQTAWLQPSCIFVPTNASDLARGLKILSETETRFAVRGGGYMPGVGRASIDGGILLVTAKLRSLSLNTLPNKVNREYLSVGSGLNWGDVYDFLDQYDRFVVGGRVSPVGTSLLLGGGISYFSSQRGWAASNVVNFEIALADGRIVNANLDENTDLFWALKGGSNNFGVVTRYDLATYPAGLMWGGAVAWSTEHTPAFLEAQKHFMLPGGGSDDPRASLMSNIEIDTKGNVTSGAMLVYDGNDPAPQAFEEFTKIPSTYRSLAVQRFAELVSPTAAYVGRDRRALFSTTSLKIDSGTMKLVHDHVVASHKSLLSGVNCSVGAGVQPVTRSFLEAASDAGDDPMNLNPEHGGFAVVLIYAYWFHVEDDGRMNDWARVTVKSIEEQADVSGLRYPFYFLNDASIEQDPFATYGHGKSIHRLKEIAKKYDPEGVFQKLVPGFKLSVDNWSETAHDEL